MNLSQDIESITENLNEALTALRISHLTEEYGYMHFASSYIL
jgi:hypothetical protein